jgi:site-specific DNA recombinase
MGDLPSLGYDVQNRKLIVNEQEALSVRHSFRRYVHLTRCVLCRQNLTGIKI